jgi:hypothetical protein
MTRARYWGVYTSRGVERVIFRLSESSQFYSRFETWRKIVDAEELEEAS